MFCSNRNNCRIWRTLTKCNVKIIGRNEYRHCLLESGIKCFPEDYPSTLAFNEYNKERSMKLIDKYKRLPFQKRPNYEKLFSPSPFFYRENNRFCSVKVEMINRGRCFEGSYICSLKIEDINMIEEMMKKNESIKSIIS